MLKLTKEHLRDKLKLFALAGFDTEVGWDTAIPQIWADQLRDMGIEDISSHFVTDCTKLLYKLHHSGEALAAIIEDRSQTNHDILRGIMDAPDTEAFMEMVNAYQEVWEEIDAGLLNVSLLAVIFNHAFKAGWDANHKALSPLINMATKTILLSELLTDRELACAAKLYKDTPVHLFARRVASEIIRPALNRIEQNAGMAVDPLYLAYALQNLFNNQVKKQ